MSNKILPKDIISKWIKEIMTHSYDITVHPKECPLSEKFLRSLQNEGWEMSLIENHKLVISCNDPLKLARLSLRLKRQGYLVED